MRVIAEETRGVFDDDVLRSGTVRSRPAAERFAGADDTAKLVRWSTDAQRPGF
jgi:hypothetical protein